MTSRMARLTSTITQDRPHLSEAIACIPHMPIPIRKALITLCRCQCGYNPKALAYIRLQDELRKPFPHANNAISAKTCLLVLLRHLDEYVTSPIYSGLISMLARNMPLLDENEVIQLKEDAVRKEMQAALEVYHPASLDWSAFLHPSRHVRHTSAILPGYPFEPKIHDEVHHLLSSAKSKISRKRFYPEYSSKTVGRLASNSLQRLAEALGEYEIENSTKGAEILYHKYGVWATGPTELRMAFKHNDLKPRVYYARGLDVYPSSRYCQSIFNIIVDALPVTNRYERYLANSIQVLSQDTVFIYDYASFTSRLFEIRNFFHRLAEFFSDVEIELVDSHFGLIRVNLGDLFSRYNETCNRNPTFDASQVFEHCCEEELLQHNCGMLGIPGNISSCTLLHGLFLIALVLSLKWKVVGDDAIGGGVVNSIEEVHEYLVHIGLIAREKMEDWGLECLTADYDYDLNTWHYTKRPITRVDNRVSLKEAVIIWPTIAALIPGTSDRFHTLIIGDERTVAKKAANTLKSFVLQFQRFPITEDDIAFIDRWIRQILLGCHLMIYDEPTQRYSLRGDLVFPVSVREGQDLSQWIDRMWYHAVTLPATSPRFHPEEEDVRLHKEFETTNVPCLKLMRDMGHASVDQKMRTFLVKDDPDYVLKWLMKTLDPGILVVTIYETVPRWMYDLFRSELLDTHSSPDYMYECDLFDSDDEIDMYVETL